MSNNNLLFSAAKNLLLSAAKNALETQVPLPALIHHINTCECDDCRVMRDIEVIGIYSPVDLLDTDGDIAQFRGLFLQFVFPEGAQLDVFERLTLAVVTHEFVLDAMQAGVDSLHKNEGTPKVPPFFPVRDRVLRPRELDVAMVAVRADLMKESNRDDRFRFVCGWTDKACSFFTFHCWPLQMAHKVIEMRMHSSFPRLVN